MTTAEIGRDGIEPVRVEQERILVDRTVLKKGLEAIAREFGIKAEIAIHAGIRRLWEERQLGILMAINFVEDAEEIEI